MGTAIIIALSWSINAAFLKGENRPWKRRAKATTATLEGIALLYLSWQLNPIPLPLSGGELYTLDLRWFTISVTGNFLTALAWAALAGSLLAAAWILKDAFINFFQLKIRGWRIFAYGGNNKGDYLSKWLWKFFDLFEGRNWFVEHWYVSDEFVREHQKSFDRFQFTIKLVCLVIAAAIFATIKIIQL